MLKPAVTLGGMLAATLLLGCEDAPFAPVPVSEPIASAQLGTLNEHASVHGDGCVPFKAHGSPGSEEVTGGPPPAPLQITSRAGGHASHRGRGKWGSV